MKHRGGKKKKNETKKVEEKEEEVEKGDEEEKEMKTKNRKIPGCDQYDYLNPKIRKSGIFDWWCSQTGRRVYTRSDKEDTITHHHR